MLGQPREKINGLAAKEFWKHVEAGEARLISRGVGGEVRRRRKVES